MKMNDYYNPDMENLAKRTQSNMILSSYDNLYVFQCLTMTHTFFDSYTFPIIQCMLSLDLVSQIDYVFATPASLSAKPDRAYLVGPSFNSKDEKGKTACHMCGKSFKEKSIHRTAYRKRMEKTYHFV